MDMYSARKSTAEQNKLGLNVTPVFRCYSTTGAVEPNSLSRTPSHSNAGPVLMVPAHNGNNFGQRLEQVTLVADLWRAAQGASEAT